MPCHACVPTPMLALIIARVPEVLLRMNSAVGSIHGMTMPLAPMPKTR